MHTANCEIFLVPSKSCFFDAEYYTRQNNLLFFRVQGHSLDHYIDKDQNNVYNILVHQKLSRKTTPTTSYAKP